MTRFHGMLCEKHRYLHFAKPVNHDCQWTETTCRAFVTFSWTHSPFSSLPAVLILLKWRIDSIVSRQAPKHRGRKLNATQRRKSLSKRQGLTSIMYDHQPTSIGSIFGRTRATRSESQALLAVDVTDRYVYTRSLWKQMVGLMFSG